MTDQLKKVLDWLYLGPNPHTNSYFRRVIVTSNTISADTKSEREEGDDDVRFCETESDDRVAQK